jgi:putative transposase
VEAVMAYIAGQEEHHRTMTFEVEFEAMLRRNGIEVDPAYLWVDADAD